jgi:hypothetical protein
MQNGLVSKVLGSQPSPLRWSSIIRWSLRFSKVLGLHSRVRQMMQAVKKDQGDHREGADHQEGVDLQEGVAHLEDADHRNNRRKAESRVGVDHRSS